MEILGLARRTDFSLGISLVVVVTVTALILGLSIAWVSLQIWNRIASGNSNYQLGLLKKRSCQGSFILSAVLGNTGFIGLAIAPLLVSDQALALVVFYSIIHNIAGTYGLGVFLSSYFGRQPEENHWWIQIRDV